MTISLDRLMGQAPDHEYDRYHFITEALMNGITLPKGHDLLDSDVFKRAKWKGEDYAKNFFDEFYRASRNGLIYQLEGNAVYKHNGLGDVGCLFFDEDEITYSISQNEVKFRLIGSKQRDEILKNHENNAIYNRLITEISELIEKDLMALEEFENQEKHCISEMMIQVYELQGRIPHKFLPNNQGRVYLTREQRIKYKEGTERLWEAFKRGRLVHPSSIQFLKHVYLEEFPVKESQINSFYKNCFKKKCHILNLDHGED